MFGPDARTILITIFLITAPVTIFCVFVGRKFIDDYPHHRGVSVLAIAVGLNLLVSPNVSSLPHPGLEMILKYFNLHRI